MREVHLSVRHPRRLLVLHLGRAAGEEVLRSFLQPGAHLRQHGHLLHLLPGDLGGLALHLQLHQDLAQRAEQDLSW